MFKKLQNLLFEDEEDDIEEEEEVIQPLQLKKKAPTPAPAPEPRMPEAPAAPVQEVPAMQRIDVTQPIQVQPSAEVKRPTESVFEAEEKVQPVKKTLGITLDDAPAAKPQPKPQAKPVKKPAPATKPVKNETGYSFNPVISPIFGVDEKDLNALKNSTNKITEIEKKKMDTNVKPIISPIYGSDDNDQPSTVQDTVEKSDRIERVTGNAFNAAAEDELPLFSVDDILKANDDKYESETKKLEKTNTMEDTFFPDLFDSIMNDESKPDDQTVVIHKDEVNGNKD